MTCPTCMSWCATSEAALATRHKKMARVPSATWKPCPQCGGIDWATSREKIEADVKKRPWWLRWNPPSWQYLRMAHILASVALLGLAWSAGASDVGMADMFLAGFNAAAVFYISFQARLSNAFDGLMTTCNEIHELNRVLISNKVEMYIRSIHRNSDDDSPPTAPTVQ